MNSTVVALQQKIAQTRETILRLQKELATLEAAKQLFEVETLRVGPEKARRRGSHDIRRKTRIINHPRKGILDAKSDPGMAKTILTDAGKVLHIDRVLDAIEDKFNKRPNKASLIGALSRYSKRKQHFYRSDEPNTFGVLERRAVPEKR